MPVDTSTSSAFLSGEWEVDIHPMGAHIVLKCEDNAPADHPMKCASRCILPDPTAFDRALGLPRVPVTVPFVYLAGAFDGGRFSISMKNTQLLGGLRLDAAFSPLLTEAKVPNFWLEGLMTIKVLLEGQSQPMSLVSRNPVLQTGRAENWPPYQTTMFDRSGPNEYIMEGGDPNTVVLTLWSGSIKIENGPVDYLEVAIPIREYHVSLDPNPGLLLEWDDIRPAMPAVQYYNIYRRRVTDLGDRGPAELVGSGLNEPRFVDTAYDDQQLFAYQVRPVHRDLFGTELLLGSGKSEFFSPTHPVNRNQLASTGFM